jgi:hypothetical protein
VRAEGGEPTKLETSKERQEILGPTPFTSTVLYVL